MIKNLLLQSAIMFTIALSIPFFADAAAGLNSSIIGPNLTSGLVGWWTFDGSNTSNIATDRSGQGNHGTITSMATSSAVVQGKVGQALKFDGVDDYVANVGSVSSYPFIQNTQIFTISGWIKLASTTARQIIVSNTVTSSEKGFWFMYETIGAGFGTKALRFVSAKGTLGTLVIDTQSPDNSITDTNWHHVVVTGTGSGNAIQFYIDGTQRTTTYNTSFTSFSSGDSSRVAFIGTGNNSGSSASPFNGSLDDIRIYNRALSATEITELYNSTKGGKINASLFGPAQPSTGLAAWWTFDGPHMTANVGDASGNSRNGSLANFAATSSVVRQGKVGQALSFDGSVTSVALSSSPVSSTASASSVCAWARTKDVTLGPSGWNQTFLNFYIDSNNGIRMGSVLNTGALFVPYRVGGTAYGAQSSAAVFTNNVWNHVCYSWNGSGMTLYANGVSVATSANTDSVATVSVLGARDDLGDGNWYGDLDDIRVYARAISAAEVAQIFAMGKGGKLSMSSAGPNLASGLVGWWTFDGPDMLTNVKDKSGQGNHGNLLGQAATTTVAGKVGQALKFDGSDDYVKTVSTVNFGNANILTVSFWLNWNAFANDDDLVMELSSNYNNNDGTFVIDPNSGGGASGKFVTSIQDSVSTGKFRMEAFTRPSAQAWHHYSIIFDNSTATGDITVYVDGVEQSTTIITNTKDQSSVFKTDTLYFMSRAGTALFGAGSLDDVRIYNRALSATEVQQLYNMGR